MITRKEKELISRYLTGDANLDDLAKEIFPRIKRVSRIVCSKIHINVDDLTQELWILFMDKIVYEYDHSFDLDGYIYGYAIRLAKHMNGENFLETNFTSFIGDSPPGDGRDERDEGSSSNRGMEAVIAKGLGFSITSEEEIYSKIRGGELLSKSMLDGETLSKIPGIYGLLTTDELDAGKKVEALKSVGFGSDLDVDKLEKASELASIAKPSGGSTTERKKNQISADQAELRSIRISMSKTKSQFAKDIGIGVAALDSYEYGITINVPKDVMDNARALLTNFTDEYANVKSIYGGWTSCRMISHWSDIVGIDITNYSALALRFGTSSITIKRWVFNKSMPKIEKIYEIHESLSLSQK